MKILNTKQAAKILGVNSSRVQQFILAGRLPAQKLGRDWVIREKDVSQFASLERKPGRPKKGGIDHG